MLSGIKQMPLNVSCLQFHDHILIRYITNAQKQLQEAKKCGKAEALIPPIPGKTDNFNTFHLTTVEILPRRTKDT